MEIKDILNDSVRKELYEHATELCNTSCCRPDYFNETVLYIVELEKGKGENKKLKDELNLVNVQKEEISRRFDKQKDLDINKLEFERNDYKWKLELLEKRYNALVLEYDKVNRKLMEMELILMKHNFTSIYPEYSQE